MKQVTKDLIDDYHLKELKIDFMGFYKQDSDFYTFHHLLVPRRLCTDDKQGYTKENGAILFSTSHSYLHIIEAYDVDLYNFLNYEMHEIKKIGEIKEDELRYIDDALSYFEDKNKNTKTSKGKLLIKEEYKNRIFTKR